MCENFCLTCISEKDDEAVEEIQNEGENEEQLISADDGLKEVVVSIF